MRAVPLVFLKLVLAKNGANSLDFKIGNATKKPSIFETSLTNRHEKCNY